MSFTSASNRVVASQPSSRFAFVASPSRMIHLGRTEVRGIDDDVVSPVEPHVGERGLAELADGVRLPGCDDVVARLLHLEHPPHGHDVVLRVPPVALRVEIPEGELLRRARA